ncbi:infection structure-specific protein [Staphylotrichum tortipilum]|uniref:Infection structure-specific protein n=1 Tax=Staphylotrichum tortipilum TaxID=2831512 RepID=A0AAN6RR49_9PEZI|nr:infection structure-specific protein [Staphylotrichum longicolle]
MFTKATLLAILAVTATASLHPRAAPNLPHLNPRQTQPADASKCQSDFMEVYASSPTPPPEILALEQTNPLTDWCVYSVPLTLSSKFESYESAVSVWVDGHVSEIHALASRCPAYSMITVSPSCWEAAAAATPTGGAGAKNGTATTSSGAGGKPSTGAGRPRETRMVAAVVALAGVVGAAAAL